MLKHCHYPSKIIFQFLKVKFMKMNLNQSMRKIFFAGTSIFLSVILLMTSCKKTDIKNNSSEQSIAAQAINRLKDVDLRLVADNFTSPIGVVAVPDASNRLFVIDQAGKIWIIGANGTRLSTPFIDVTSRLATLSPFYDERGL
jgi:hypothetical protein